MKLADGTWMYRRYSPLYGIQAVKAFDTQKVIDVEVFSKHSNYCGLEAIV